jgi:hypothetical protein
LTKELELLKTFGLFKNKGVRRIIMFWLVLYGMVNMNRGSIRSKDVGGYLDQSVGVGVVLRLRMEGITDFKTHTHIYRERKAKQNKAYHYMFTFIRLAIAFGVRKPPFAIFISPFLLTSQYDHEIDEKIRKKILK